MLIAYICETIMEYELIKSYIIQCELINLISQQTRFIQMNIYDFLNENKTKIIFNISQKVILLFKKTNKIKGKREKEKERKIRRIK